MKFAQIAKRVLLFGAVNILVVVTLSLVLNFLGVGRYVPGGAGYQRLAVFCLVWGMGGAFISLAISRLMAKWMMGVKVISPDTSDPVLRDLVDTVYRLARAAELPVMPEVGYYESDEVNAFATGPTKSRALVAVSTGLLRRMTPQQVEGVLGHEISHVANGDMVTMTLIQGVMNAFVMFLARVLAFAVSQAMRSKDDDRESGGSFLMQYLLVSVFEMVLSVFGFMVVCWFSRWREFRADAGGARLAGRQDMIDALRSLARMHDPKLAAEAAQQSQSFQAFKISGQSGGIASLFSTHPPLEERIARLENAR